MSKIGKKISLILFGLFIFFIFEKVIITNNLAFDESLALKMVFLMIFSG